LSSGSGGVFPSSVAIAHFIFYNSLLAVEESWGFRVGIKCFV
jgi:hypothetical protein